MKIYVIIPTHNSEKTIESTLKSYIKIKNTVNLNFEAVIVDDHSIDSTVSIVKKLSNSFKIMPNFGIGVSEARNTALKYIYRLNENDDVWVTFLDSDDCLKEDFFENLVNININNYNYIAFEYVRHVRKVINGNNKAFLKKIDTETALQQAISGFENEKYNFNSPWGRIIKVDFLKQHEIFFKKELKYKEDFLFNIELLSKNPNIAICNKIGYIHIVNQSSVVNNYIDKAFLNEKIIQNYLKQLNITDYQRNIAKYNCWLGLQYIYVFPKHYKKDTLSERRKRYLEIRNYIKPFKFKRFYGGILTKEFIFYLFYKFKMFYLLDCIFSIRRCNENISDYGNI